MVGEQFESVEKFETLGLHDPGKDVSGFSAGKAFIASGIGGDIKTGAFVVVKRTKPQLVLARTFEPNALRN